ncbi:MAG: hypothetical protein HY360_21950 [Verrucomicrobia bacterium]|nr:hypothetical protein [Verrucomicrobiota bacterium]
MDFFIYVICFGVGLLFAIMSACSSHIFGGHEGHLDVGASGHAEAGYSNEVTGFSPLSPTVIATFVTAFGGLGMVLSRFALTSSPWISAPLAALGGLGIAGGVFAFFNRVFQIAESSSESKVASLMGMTATVISPIPQNGVGEIAYVQAGTRYTAPAREEHGAAVANGQVVKISRVVGTEFFVVPA